MNKKTIFRGFLGFPLGVFISYTITIIISLIFANGYYSPVVPSLIKQCGNEINAVIIQFVLSGIFGSICCASSVVWERDEWSILKQSFIHFIIISFTLFPIAYLTHWMEHSIIGTITYFAIFIFIYIVIWIIKYNIWKYRVNQINKKIQNKNK